MDTLRKSKHNIYSFTRIKGYLEARDEVLENLVQAVPCGPEALQCCA
jgi:hypothetical protein